VSILKALVIWGATQAIQDLMRSRSGRVFVLPIWIIGLAFISPTFAIFLAFYLTIVTLWAVFYRIVWGQTYD